MPSMIAPYPPLRLRQLIDKCQWEQCLGSWIQCLRRGLHQNHDKFASDYAKNAALAQFLVLYVNEAVDEPASSAQSKSLRRNVFRMVHRLLTLPADTVPGELLKPEFLAKLSLVFHSAEVRSLFETLRKEKQAISEADLSILRDDIVSSVETIDALDSAAMQELDIKLRALAMMVMIYPDFSEVFLLGSDFLNALSVVSGYKSRNDGVHHGAISQRAEYLAYVLFVAMVHSSAPKYSALLDQLYDLGEVATNGGEGKGLGSNQRERVFVRDLVSRTPLLRKLERPLKSKAASRSDKVLGLLGNFCDPMLSPLEIKTLCGSRQLRLKKESRMKKKGGVSAEASDNLDEGVQQLLDLFPGLDVDSAKRMLSTYDYNVGLATSKLLDNNGEAVKDYGLPTHADIAKEELDPSGVHTGGQLHVGRKGEFVTADSILGDKSLAPSKNEILAALAAINSDDDERDDTYDADDVGGLVDAGEAGEQNTDGDDREDMILYHALVTNPSVFERNADTRRGKDRLSLRQATGFTDESIEGWKIMLNRDKRRQSRLESRYSIYSREQSNTLPSNTDAHPGSQGRRAPRNFNSRAGGGGGGGGGPSSGASAKGQASDNRRDKKHQQQKTARTSNRRKAQRFKKAGNSMNDT